MNIVKRPAVLVVVVFLGFYLMHYPAELARIVSASGAALWALTSSVFEALIRFLHTLLR